MVSIWLTNRLTEDRAGDRTRRIENGVARAASAWERFSGRAWLRGAHKKRRSPKRRPSALPMATQDQGAAGQTGGAWGLRPTWINADRRAWFRRPCEYFRNATARSTRRSVSDAPDDATGDRASIAGIAGFAWCAARRDRDGRSNTARRGTPRR